VEWRQLEIKADEKHAASSHSGHRSQPAHCPLNRLLVLPAEAEKLTPDARSGGAAEVMEDTRTRKMAVWEHHWTNGLLTKLIVSLICHSKYNTIMAIGKKMRSCQRVFQVD
jgi:hypothetical protein